MPNKSIIKLPHGLYVLMRDKESILSEIELILTALNRTLDDNEAVAECRACRRRIKRLVEESLVDTRTKYKCIYSLEHSDTDNAERSREYGKQMFDFLCDLSVVVSYSVCFSDLPSCRSLLDYSTEEAADKAVDLVENGIVKTVAKTLIFGSKVYHIKEIADVRNYYNGVLSSFLADTSAGLKPTGAEMVFENRSRVELEYCRLASLKVAGKLTKEALEVGMKAIENIRMSQTDAEIAFPLGVVGENSSYKS